MNFTSKALVVILILLSAQLYAERIDTTGAPIITELDTILCPGEILNGIFDTPGIYMDTISGGVCDTVSIISLDYFPRTPNMATNVTVCEGADIPEPGPIPRTDANGCEFFETIAVTVIQSQPNQITNGTICHGDTFVWNDQIFTESGTYETRLVGTNGCDSLLVLNLEVLPELPDVITDAEICDGDTILWNNLIVTEIGSYEIELINPNIGCNFTDILRVTERPIDQCVSSTESAQLSADIELYPNPASDYLTVDGLGSSQESHRVQLMNGQGQVVASEITQEAQVKLDISTLSSGIYTTKISRENSGVTKTLSFLKK